MPPRKRMRWKQPAPSGSGQPPANSSRGSTVDGHSAVGRSIRLESSDASHLAAKALRPQPRRRKLSLAEVASIKSVPGVPFRGCSVHGTTKCGIAQGGSGIATSGGPHLAACSQKEEDVPGSGDSSIEQPAV